MILELSDLDQGDQVFFFFFFLIILGGQTMWVMKLYILT